MKKLRNEANKFFLFSIAALPSRQKQRRFGGGAKGEQPLRTRAPDCGNAMGGCPKDCGPGRTLGRQSVGYVRPSAAEKRKKLFHNVCSKPLPFLPLRSWRTSISPLRPTFPVTIFL